MRFRRFALKFTIVVMAIVLSFLLLEIAVRTYHTAKVYFAPVPANTTQPVKLHIETTASHLYELNPAHPDISSQGTRDDEVAIPKPKGTFRVLVLGDSVAYGSRSSRESTFPNRLESQLRQSLNAAEVVNASVMGYTAYNELHYYLEKGRRFEANLVVVAFCMNDIVNPRLHWGDTPQVKFPEASIPNQVYDRDHVLPLIEKRRQEQLSESSQNVILKRSALYKAIAPAIKRLSAGETTRSKPSANGFPTYLTAEDSIGIEVLLDKSSSEWLWLTSIYSQLNDAVQKEHGRLLIVLVPLAYQLDDGYPYFPQKNLLEFCRESSIPCLDLFSAFKEHRKEDIFLLDKETFYDVWHLTDYGHQLAGDELLSFIQKNGLLTNN